MRAAAAGALAILTLLVESERLTSLSLEQSEQINLYRASAREVQLRLSACRDSVHDAMTA